MTKELTINVKIKIAIRFAPAEGLWK